MRTLTFVLLAGIFALQTACGDAGANCDALQAEVDALKAQVAEAAAPEVNPDAIYAIAHFDITDAEAYKGYSDKVGATLQEHQVEVLSVDREATSAENEVSGFHAILRFHDRAHFDAWYNSDAYQAILGIRLENSKNSYVALTKQFMPPKEDESHE